MSTSSRSAWRVLAPVVAVLALVAVPLRGSGADAAETDGNKQSFSVHCKSSHERTDDPIVYPNQPGASHLHAFMGNTATDASSSYESLRAAGTTCLTPSDKAAYWVPALYDDGAKVAPSKLRVYYVAGRKDHRKVRSIPPGLAMLTKNQQYVWWTCAGLQEDPVRSRTVPTCAAGKHLVKIIWFADCWDGARLDSPDHMSHVVFTRNGACPSTHPVPIPQVQLNVHYPSDGGEVVLAPLSAPSLPHADFVNAWDQPALDHLVRNCINAGRECSFEQTWMMTAQLPK